MKSYTGMYLPLHVVVLMSPWSMLLYTSQLQAQPLGWTLCKQMRNELMKIPFLFFVFVMQEEYKRQKIEKGIFKCWAL